MRIEENFDLKAYNSFHLPVKCRWFMEYSSEEELMRILRDEYFQECLTLPIGGGSNLLFINDFAGVVLHSLVKGIEVVEENEQELLLRVGASERWDDVVAYACTNGWGGIENLSLIPGEMSGAVVQNIGAYGVELKEVVEQVEAYNQLSFEKRIFSKEQCCFAYRSSCFKDEQSDPHIITYVTIRLRKQPDRFQLSYGKLKEELGEVLPTPLLVRNAVIAIRESKLPDPEVLGNAGSFFMNPVVTTEHFEQLKKRYPDMPAYPDATGGVKLAAGWLIEQCGFKGKRHGEVGVYEKQALILVNYGEAAGHEIALAAESIRAAVAEQFAVELTPEVKYIG